MEFYKTRNFDRKKSKNSYDSKRKPSFRNSRNAKKFSSDNARGESATVTCADCGTECEIPFIPKHDRPVYCSDCFRQNKPSQHDDYRNERQSRNNRNSRYSQDNARGESATVTCADCGTECEIPFIPKHDRPVYCSDCFRQNKPSQHDDYRNERQSRNNRNSRYSQDNARGESATVTCADCGTECEIPFIPKHDRPVYCSDCFRQNKPSQHDDYRNERQSRNNRNSRYSDTKGRSNLHNDRDDYQAKSKTRKILKKQEALYAGGSDKFYASLKEKLFEILGGKICSSCGFKDERALGVCHIHDDSVFDNIRRGGFASSWGKYISEPNLAKEELRVLCLNCNEVRQPISKPKSENNIKTKRKKSRYFPR